MIHPETELRFINPYIGYGVFAKSDLPKGTITWVTDPLDREISPDQLQAMPSVQREMVLTYSYRNNTGNFVLCWDITRYMNHCYTPNVMATAYGIEVAIRDIKKGDQLTNDYGFLNILEPFDVSEADEERKTVYPDDILRFYPVWDAQLREVFPLIPQRHQLLREMIDFERWSRIVEVSENPKVMKSILGNLFVGKK